MSNTNLFGQTPDSDATITTTASVAFVAAERREGVIVSNIGNHDAFLAFDVTALVNKGIWLPKGSTSTFDTACYSDGPLSAITAVGTTTLIWQEFHNRL